MTEKSTRDIKLKKAAELLSGSKQPLPPGMIAHSDRLFVENDKAITSMPSHHNLAALFEILCNQKDKSIKRDTLPNTLEGDDISNF